MVRRPAIRHGFKYGFRYAVGPLALALAVAALSAGCASVFKQPVVTVESVSLNGIGLRGASLLASLHIENPNGFALETRSLSYLLELQDPDSASRWLELVHDTIDQEIAVAANSSGSVQIPFEFPFRELGPAVRALLESGTFGYRVSGRIAVTRPISRSVPYRKTGRVTLQGAR